MAAEEWKVTVNPRDQFSVRGESPLPGDVVPRGTAVDLYGVGGSTSWARQA